MTYSQKFTVWSVLAVATWVTIGVIAEGVKVLRDGAAWLVDHTLVPYPYHTVCVLGLIVAMMGTRVLFSILKLGKDAR